MCNKTFDGQASPEPAGELTVLPRTSSWRYGIDPQKGKGRDETSHFANR